MTSCFQGDSNVNLYCTIFEEPTYGQTERHFKWPSKKKAFQIQAFVDILIYSKSWKLSLDQIWNMIL